MSAPKPAAIDVERAERELHEYLRKQQQLGDADQPIADALAAMERAPRAAALIQAESIALLNLIAPLQKWSAAHIQAQTVRDQDTHEARDETMINAKLAEAVEQLLSAEIARRTALPRAEALDSAATVQRRGSGPAVEWFTSYAVQRGFDARALMLLEAIAVTRGIRLRPEATTYWANPTAARKEWAVLISRVLSPHARRT